MSVQLIHLRSILSVSILFSVDLISVISRPYYMIMKSGTEIRLVDTLWEINLSLAIGYSNNT